MLSYTPSKFVIGQWRTITIRNTDMATINPLPTYTETKTALLFANESITKENNQTILSAPEFPTKIISNELLFWTEIIGYASLNSIVSAFGIIANIINIIVFKRRGVLRDSNTVSLLILSMSDFCALVTLLWMAIGFMLVYIQPPNLPFSARDMLYLTGGRPHLMFVQMSGWLTAYIAFERCMCVVFPFKVRRLFTARRTLIVLIIIIASVVFGGYLPYYVGEYLIWRKIPGTNRSILVFYVAPSAKLQPGDTDYKAILNVFVAKPTALILIFVFTQITVFRVNISRKWRMKTSSSSSKSNKEKTQKTDSNKGEDVKESENSEPSDKEMTEIGSREKRLAKMITSISTIFIACNAPNIFIIITESIEERIAIGGPYHNLFFFLYVFSFIFQGLNCTINIFVYYNMSTKYRYEFRKLFGKEG